MQILLKELFFYSFYTTFDEILRFLLQTKKNGQKVRKKIGEDVFGNFLTCFKIKMSFYTKRRNSRANIKDKNV